MGKRELFIAIAFILVGVVAYELTAPPPKAGEEGFSFSRLWNNARRGMRGNPAQVAFTQTGTFQAPTGVSEIRFEGNARRVRVIGESRTDIAYELAVESNGPDAPTALGYAKNTVLKQDNLGPALALRISYPREGRQSATLQVRVPSRFGVLIASPTPSGGIEASHVAAVHLDNVSADATITNVAGAVVGGHRNGVLTVRDVGSVKMTLQRSRATFDGVQQAVTLDIRDGECAITNSNGPVELDENRAEVTIAGHHGTVRVGGTEGRVSLNDPRQESKIDVRRAEVEVRLVQAIPLTLLTTDETLRLLLDGPPRVMIDAAANLGHIQAADFGLQPESVDQESRLTHDFGNGGPRVSLRNLRGDIVIRNSHAEIVIKKSK
jgi:hypothetical protein